MILNEALSFGVLGATGRGLTEMYGIDVKEIEIVTMSMAHSLASVGGLCIGTTQVIVENGGSYRYSRGNARVKFSRASIELDFAEGSLRFGFCLLHDINRKNPSRRKYILSSDATLLIM